ncbi:MAG: putative dehydrogenase [Francisellaceae bacterium]|jgi:predicted dehydrogenase
MIWLIGAGGMSIDYAKVLDAQKKDFIVIGRGKSSAKLFEEKTGHNVCAGSLTVFLSQKPELPDAAIVSVGVEHLYNATKELLEYGVKRLLVEKPGGLTFNEVKQLEEQAIYCKASIYIAYNRRFYSSVAKVLELVELEGGVTSFNFELTEWSHIIEKLDKSEQAFSKWFIGNSTHVADLAFFLGGKPKDISCYSAGQLDWHPASSIFAGAGISDNGALFNYDANWESAGRWSVEVLTNENRYILRPMESLQVQARGTIKQDPVDIDDSLDTKFKPGLYLQVESFLKNDNKLLCSISEQALLFPVYYKMAGYK